MTPRLVVVLALAAWCALGASPQPSQDAGDVQAEIERLIAVARDGAPPVRPQAAERLLALGEQAAATLRERVGDSNEELVLLGSDLVELLARFGDASLRARAWSVLAEPDFPWRPAAARSLAQTASAAELARFLAWLDDPLPAVRVAALDALAALDARPSIDHVRGLLGDEHDRVRRSAACLLDLWGERGALHWLVEELRRTDTFFRNPTGRLARQEAARLLTERLGDCAGYRPEKDPSEPENAAAIAALLARVRERAGGALPELPAVARASQASSPDRFGLEVRSCRRGETFLRWNAGDQLLVGTGNARVFELAPGSVAALETRLKAILEELGEKRAFGVAGCDVEQFHWVADVNGKVRTVVASKGPAPLADLRPPALTELYRALFASLDGVEESAALDALRERLDAALVSVGGPLSRD